MFRWHADAIGVVFILGVSQRSGTNYLARLLQCHADCGSPAMPLAEDHLLGPADLLTRYADAVTRRWHPNWGEQDPARTDLEVHIGTGLLSFLEARSDRPVVVTKTPNFENLRLYPRLFPRTPLLLLVRDGRVHFVGE